MAMNDYAFLHVDNVLRTVLALFTEDKALPLPTLEEVLICNSNTTAEEVREMSHMHSHCMHKHSALLW